MRRLISRSLAVLMLCVSLFCMTAYATDGSAQSEPYSVTLIQQTRGSSTSEVVATVSLQAPFSYQLTAPAGCVLPSSVFVKVNDRPVSNEDEQVYSYDKTTGEIQFHQGSITGSVSITANYPSGLLYVGNQIVYQNHKENTAYTSGLQFDPTTNTLTLEDITIQNGYTSGNRYLYGIYTTLEPLNIVVKGKNEIILPEDTTLNAYGIYAKGAVCISGFSKDASDTLSITTGTVTRSNDSATNCGIYSSNAKSSLLFEDVSIDIQTGSVLSEESSANNYGICVNSAEAGYGGITFRNCNLSIKGGNSTAARNASCTGIYVGGYDCDPICIENSDLSIHAGTASSQRNATSNGMDLCGDLLITSARVTTLSADADCAEGTAIGNGLHSLSSITAKDSKLRATSAMPEKGKEIDSITCGVFANSLTLMNSDLQCQGNSSALRLMDSLALDYGSNKAYRWTVSERIPYTSGQNADYRNKSNHTFLHIFPDTKPDIKDEPSTDTPPDTTAYFVDVHDVSHWATPAIEQAAAEGLMLGTDATHFSPEAKTTRGMVVTILWRLEQEPILTGAPSFPDIGDTWYTDAVRWATDKELVNGYSDGTFGPDDFITREQLLTILWRYAKEKGVTDPADAKERTLPHSDAGAISQYAVSACLWAYDTEIITGKPGNLLVPQDTATRAEFAHILMKYLAIAE